LETNDGRRLRSRPGLALAVIGCILVLLAPAWRWGIGPLFIRLPGNLNLDVVYEGTMTVFADRETSKFYPAGEEVTTSLRIDGGASAVPSMSDSRVLVLEENVTVSDGDTGQLLPGLRPPTSYALDRRTCENVPGRLPGIDRTGYSLKLPMGAGKKLYGYWDDDLGSRIACRFIGEDRLDGNRAKGVKVYVYGLGGSIEKMAKPPPGLPESITGKTAKALAGDPDLPIADGAEMKLDYYKKTDATLDVEPKTGTIVYLPKYHYEYYVKNAPGQPPEYLKLAEVEYARDDASARADIDNSARLARLIDLDLRRTPLSFLVLGLFLLVLGAVLSRKALTRSRATQGEGP